MEQISQMQQQPRGIIELEKTRHIRQVPVFTFISLSACLPVYTSSDMREGRGVYAQDINEAEGGIKVSVR